MTPPSEPTPSKHTSPSELAARKKERQINRAYIVQQMKKLVVSNMESSYGYLCASIDLKGEHTNYFNTIGELTLIFYDNGNYWFQNYETEEQCSYNYDDDNVTCSSSADAHVKGNAQ